MNPDADPRVQARGWLNRTVGGVGLTSAPGDLCYETMTVVLPGFLAVLGIPAAALGTSPTFSFGLAATLMAAGTRAMWRLRPEHRADGSGGMA